MTHAAVLFDLDDTLFDHHGSSRAALARVHAASIASSAAFEAFERHHAHFLEELHVEVLAGRLSLDAARIERFRRVFAALGLTVTAGQAAGAAAAYRDGYRDARRGIDGARELLALLHARTRVAVVSNNLLDEQQEKIALCGFAPFVDALVVSEEVGAPKPAAAMFETALARLGVAVSDAIMIGDSWAADIEGARAAGLRAIWFNPGRRPPPPGAREVEQLHALVPAGDTAARILAALHRPLHAHRD
ncbi:MAG TPA: HAD-IA family hydrolase [Vicinamibacterales bacterium]|nr:HAD-IA family hydrolase [Vicinamibacterales bacterium]